MSVFEIKKNTHTGQAEKFRFPSLFKFLSLMSVMRVLCVYCCSFPSFCLFFVLFSLTPSKESDMNTNTRIKISHLFARNQADLFCHQDNLQSSLFIAYPDINGIYFCTPLGRISLFGNSQCLLALQFQFMAICKRRICTPPL